MVIVLNNSHLYCRSIIHRVDSTNRKPENTEHYVFFTAIENIAEGNTLSAQYV